MTRARLIGVTLLAALALTACSSDSSDENEVPRDWINKEYVSSGPYYLDGAVLPPRVADEIDGRAPATDRATGDDMVFLRYANDIVAVIPYQDGSRIEIDGYSSGYHRWSTYVGHWPAPGSEDFRGGGPGSGK